MKKVLMVLSFIFIAQASEAFTLHIINTTKYNLKVSPLYSRQRGVCAPASYRVGAATIKKGKRKPTVRPIDMGFCCMTIAEISAKNPVTDRKIRTTAYPSRIGAGFSCGNSTFIIKDIDGELIAERVKKKKK